MEKLYISTTFAKDGTPLIDALRQCESESIQNIEIGSNHCYQTSYDYLNDFSFNYLVHNYFPIPKNSFVLNIASFDEQIRSMSIAHIKKAIDLCVQIDAGLYTFHPGFLTDPSGSNQSQKNYDFQWDESQLGNTNYKKATSNIFSALDDIIKYAQSRKIKIAIETEGSLKKKNHLLMQQPWEYDILLNKYSSSDLGINLNIGHLNLASKAFGFDPLDFVNLISNSISSMELSHNDGVEDQHLPLINDSWYWEIILNPIFDDCYKILEFRNTSIKNIKENISLFLGKKVAV
tara:strand:- start:506 stop:1375 length:870 start_codon:yes stop_codon:yes gene_type:complete